MSVDRLVEKVDIFISGHDLAKVHTFNMTDAFAVLYAHDRTKNVLTKLGTTEIVRDNRSPNWTTIFTMDYNFEIIQNMVIRVFQEEGGKPTTDENRHSIIGESTFRLSDLMCASCQKLSLGVKHSSRGDQGTVQVRAEPKTNTRDLLCVTFAGQKLANKDGFFGRSDPYLVVSRLNEDSSWTVVWKSYRVDNNLNPRWIPVKIPMGVLCNGDIDRPLRVEIFDYDENSSHDTMGIVETSVRGMITSNGSALPVIETAKKGKKGYTNSGTLTCSQCVIEEHPSFSDFIVGGCELSLIVAIDFTGSNGDPKMPQSLHYVDTTGVAKNQYQEAILSVGTIVEAYDTDKKFPVYGFGARCRQPNGEYSQVQHCFPVFGGGFEVDGVSGILQAYQAGVQNVMFSGPTLFAPLITNAITHTASMGCSQSNQKYNILLILTDGVINDMDATKAAIIQASTQPMSIIIIGVGNADFSEMRDLDSDGKMLSYGGKTATRDIVQFVSYKECAARGASELSQQVLAEIPNQVLQYFQQNRIKPNPKKA